MEMQAKLENFGPFHMFYTLSCGDMRWDENFTSILKDKGYNIIWSAESGKFEDCVEVIVEVEYEKGGQQKYSKLRDFLKEEVDDSLHEFIRTNVFTATRNFVQRLKSFRKEIMMGKNSPMSIVNFSDKLEFQGRGAGHIHGAAWCDLSKVSEVLDIQNSIVDAEDGLLTDSEDDDEIIVENNENLNPESDLEKAFKKLRRDEKLLKKEEMALIAFADKFITCTLNPDMVSKMIDESTSLTEGIEIVKKAEETQTHHHTKTCKKNGPSCRFGMPRFPLWRTMLTREVKGKSIEERCERKKKHKDVLNAVQEVLESDKAIEAIWKSYGPKKEETKKEYIINRKKRILKVLELASVSVKSYVAAVKEYTKKGINVILARDIDEMFINNYNPEWLRAWNANIDIQLCFDIFTGITYITEYFTKDESGTSAFLSIAAKKCSEMCQTDLKRHLKNVFLTHRQMGICEAFMKILPEMRFKDSTIGTDFLQLGKKEDMSRFVVRADRHDISGHQSFLDNKVVFKIPDREGLYFEKPNWIDKYFRRGKALEDICPSHFVKIYDSFSGKAPKIAEDNDSHEEEDEEQDNEETDTIRKYGKETKFHHFITSEGKLGKPLPTFVLLENPCPGEPKFLKKRKHPKALRLFKVKRENNPARFFLQELMLYTCFDEKMYNDWHDDDKCMQAYLEKEEEIRAVKNQVMEWLEDVEEGRYFVEETMKNQIETGEIGEVLDVENEKDIEECEQEGIEADPLYEHLDRGDHNENEFSPSSNWCKKIELMDEDLNMKKTQNLDKYQKKTLDIALKYARDLVKSHHYKNALPETPNLIVLGGAGLGNPQ